MFNNVIVVHSLILINELCDRMQSNYLFSFYRTIIVCSRAYLGHWQRVSLLNVRGSTTNAPWASSSWCRSGCIWLAHGHALLDQPSSQLGKRDMCEADDSIQFTAWYLPLSIVTLMRPISSPLLHHLVYRPIRYNINQIVVGVNMEFSLKSDEFCLISVLTRSFHNGKSSLV